MTRRTKKVLLGISLGALVACGEDRLAGGTTQTDNMAAARTFDVDSLLGDGNRPENVPTIATLRLTSANMVFEESRADGSDLVIELVDGHPVPFRIVYWDRSAARGRIQVRLDPNAQGIGARIRLRWGASSLPAGDSAAVWSGIPDSQRLALTSVLVSDFEQESLLSLLPHPGVWYSNSGDSASISEVAILSTGKVDRGNALHVTFVAPIRKSFALVGVPLGVGPYSLRSLDSIEVWARGANTILTVSFDHQGTDDRKAWTPRYPDSTWRRFVVRPGDLDSASGNGGNVGWMGVRDSVTHLSFFAAQGEELWIDDVRLHGVDADDLK
ncbi:MAG: hypothetical protein H6686_11010 [Fibrobacteria bacterium]|nr:hypothetical protein [Fibrobacteria bacterium]